MELLFCVKVHRKAKAVFRFVYGYTLAYDVHVIFNMTLCDLKLKGRRGL